jgi:hypothetical protein
VWQLLLAFSGTFATLAQQLTKAGWLPGGKKPPEGSAE